MSKCKVSNSLALACFCERPMHPYEIASTLRERNKDESIKLNDGSHYAVVEALKKHELIAAHVTEREGNRPQRTVYRITDAGRLELIDRLSEFLSRPAREYTHFEAALSPLRSCLRKRQWPCSSSAAGHWKCGQPRLSR